MASVRVLTFARLRELFGDAERNVEIEGGARVRDVWSVLVRAAPAIDQLERSTRAAKNGRLVAFDEPVGDGDELAFLPPVGGG